MSGRFLLALLAVLPASAPAFAEEGVRVKVVRLEGAGERLAGREVSVRVSIGGRKLYETPPARAERAEWNKSLRAWTGGARPLVFRVDATGEPGTPAAAAPAEPSRPRVLTEGDAALSTGLDDLVADYGSGSLDEGAEPGARDRARKDAKRRRANDEARESVRKAARPAKGDGRASTVCKATLAWPPPDGEHRLECRGMTLVVTTRSL